jgi:hypothetical protein
VQLIGSFIVCTHGLNSIGRTMRSFGILGDAIELLFSVLGAAFVSLWNTLGCPRLFCGPRQSELFKLLSPATRNPGSTHSQCWTHKPAIQPQKPFRSETQSPRIQPPRPSDPEHQHPHSETPSGLRPRVPRFNPRVSENQKPRIHTRNHCHV